MLPTPQSYAIYPAVIQADTPTEIVIVPTERARLFTDGATYELTVIACDGDEPDYYKHPSHVHLTLCAEGGVLRFTHSFCGEMSHLLLLSLGEKVIAELVVYSLYTDLYARRPLRGDLHTHSLRSDGSRDPVALAGHYREMGYDFLALTDHNRFYPGGEIDEVYESLSCGLVRVPGEEIHAPGSTLHVIHVGGGQSVAAQYVNDLEGYLADIKDYLTRVPAHIPEGLRERYARAMWTSDRIHEAGGLAIFPHPFWHPRGSRTINVTPEYAALLLSSGLFDAYEMIGSMGQVGNNRSLALWGELREQGVRIPVVGASDIHHIENSTKFPNLFTLVFAKERTAEGIVAAIKEGLSVAVEATGVEHERHYRCYGSLRLVSYAQFLLHHYFPLLSRVAQGEGVAMRAYAMGEADASLISMQAQLAEKCYRRFFGLLPPPLPTNAMMDFEERWRAVHELGPKTRGAVVFPDLPVV